jgi:hypothetical protein
MRAKSRLIPVLSTVDRSGKLAKNQKRILLTTNYYIMKNTTLTLAAGAASLMFIGSASAAAVISASATAPTVTTHDIANAIGNEHISDNASDLWPNRPSHGQSFLTLSNVGGYMLNSVTLKSNSGGDNGESGTAFNVVIGSLAAGVMTQIGTTETAVSSSYSSGDWITFTLDTPLALAASTQYGFLMGGSAGGGFRTASNLDDSTYTGGAAISSGSNTGVPNLNSVTDNAGDRVFHVGLTAVPVPEPSTTALLGLGGLALILRRRK